MPYRPKFGLYPNSPIPAIDALPMASVQGGAIACIIAFLFAVFSGQQPFIDEMNAGNVFSAFAMLPIIGAFAWIGATITTAIFIGAFGTPIAWLLRERIRHRYASIVAIGATLVPLGIMIGQPFEDPASILRNLDTLALGLCAATPIALNYRRLIIESLDTAALD